MKQTLFGVAPGGAGGVAASLPIAVTNPAINDSTSTTVLAANASRRYLEIVNGLAATAIWVNFGAAAGSGAGIRVPAGSSWYMEVTNDMGIYRGDVRVWQDSGAPTTLVGVIEG